MDGIQCNVLYYPRLSQASNEPSFMWLMAMVCPRCVYCTYLACQMQVFILLFLLLLHRLFLVIHYRSGRYERRKNEESELRCKLLDKENYFYKNHIFDILCNASTWMCVCVCGGVRTFLYTDKNWLYTGRQFGSFFNVNLCTFTRLWSVERC